MKLTRRSFSIFWVPLLGLWTLLGLIMTTIDLTDLKRVIPLTLYFLTSFLCIYQIQDEIIDNHHDPIIKIVKARALIICLLISTIAIFFDLLYFKEKLYLWPSIFIVTPILISTFMSGLSAYSEDQLSNGFLTRSKERSASIISREKWNTYLNQLKKRFPESQDIKNEVEKIQNILPYSSFFRGKNSFSILQALQNQNSEEIILETLVNIK